MSLSLYIYTHTYIHIYIYIYIYIYTHMASKSKFFLQTLELGTLAPIHALSKNDGLLWISI